MKKSFTAIAFLLLVGVFTVLTIPKIMKINELRERSENLKEEVRRLEFENKKMEMELRLLKEDPVYLEKVAREKFNKAKEGEIVYKVVRSGEAGQKAN